MDPASEVKQLQNQWGLSAPARPLPGSPPGLSFTNRVSVHLQPSLSQRPSWLPLPSAGQEPQEGSGGPGARSGGGKPYPACHLQSSGGQYLGPIAANWGSPHPPPGAHRPQDPRAFPAAWLLGGDLGKKEPLEPGRRPGPITAGGGLKGWGPPGRRTPLPVPAPAQAAPTWGRRAGAWRSVGGRGRFKRGRDCARPSGWDEGSAGGRRGRGPGLREPGRRGRGKLAGGRPNGPGRCARPLGVGRPLRRGGSAEGWSGGLRAPRDPLGASQSPPGAAGPTAFAAELRGSCGRRRARGRGNWRSSLAVARPGTRSRSARDGDKRREPEGRLRAERSGGTLGSCPSGGAPRPTWHLRASTQALGSLGPERGEKVAATTAPPLARRRRLRQGSPGSGGGRAVLSPGVGAGAAPARPGPSAFGVVKLLSLRHAEWGRFPPAKAPRLRGTREMEELSTSVGRGKFGQD